MIENDNNIRPKYLKDYIGQSELKNNIAVFLSAAKNRKESLDHTLLYGPPGLGKTTLANIIANEMNSNIKLISGPSIEKPGDLAGVLSSLEAGDILFIDEIHRLPNNVEEMLYSAMEDFKLVTMVGVNENVTNIEIPLPPFTLVGATTKAGNLSSPFRARFGITLKFDFYTVEELKELIIRSAKILNSEIDNDGALELAKRSRGTPRRANSILKRVRDFAEYKSSPKITLKIVKDALIALKIDELGLEEVDIKYLRTILDHFSGGPVGVNAIASTIGEEVIDLLDIYEPYLVLLGLIVRTPRGRMITKLGKNHLKSKNI